MAAPTLPVPSTIPVTVARDSTLFLREDCRKEKSGWERGGREGGGEGAAQQGRLQRYKKRKRANTTYLFAQVSCNGRALQVSRSSN